MEHDKILVNFPVFRGPCSLKIFCVKYLGQKLHYIKAYKINIYQYKNNVYKYKQHINSTVYIQKLK